MLVVTKNNDASLHVVQGPIVHRTITSINLPTKPDEISDIYVTPQSGTWQLVEVELQNTDMSKPMVFRDAFNSQSPYLQPLTVVLPQDPQLTAINNDEYEQFKEYILMTACKTTTIGTMASYVLASPDKSYAYLIGGTVGIIYAAMLQGSTNPPTRLLFVFTCAAAAMTHYNTQIHADNRILLFAFIGFLMTRVGYFSRPSDGAA